MHVIIANKVANELKIVNKTQFLLGGIVADATADKETSHFFVGKHEEYTRKIDYEKFISKYKNLQTNHYILGYYAHLIADEIWLSGFYLPWLKNRIESSPDVLNLYHKDFHILNAKLMEHYGYRDELIELLGQPAKLIEIEEIRTENIVKLCKYVIEDMHYEMDAIMTDLKVFTFEQIIGYIETSVEKSLYFIKQKIDE